MAELVVPQVRTELPGPRTRALLERKDAVLNGPLRDWTGVPLAVGEQGRLHHRGPGRQHVRRPRQRLGCLAVRRAAAVRPRRDDPGLGPLRDGDHRTTCRASRSIALAERLVELAPGRITRVAPTVTGTRGGRGRGQAGPRGDRPADDPQLPRAVPRRVDVPGRRELDGHLGADDGERASTCRGSSSRRTRTASARRSTAGPARSTTRCTSTTSRTGCCVCRSSRSRSPASSSSRSRVRRGSWRRRRRSGTG